MNQRTFFFPRTFAKLSSSRPQEKRFAIGLQDQRDIGQSASRQGPLIATKPRLGPLAVARLMSLFVGEGVLAHQRPWAN